MNIDTITEFFYQKLSDRVRTKIDNTMPKLTYRDIYIKDPSLISRICKNQKTKNNPYLICDAVLYSSAKNIKTGSYVESGLIPILNFNSAQEVLWGNCEEINSYLFDLFKLLWNEIAEENIPNQNKAPEELKPDRIDKELFLCDYIPYAKYSTYWNILFNPQNIFPAIAYGIYEDTVIANIDSAREYAFRFLYDKCKNNFAEIFINFTNQTDTFHKIDQALEKSFIEDLFLPMLRKFKPGDNSLGLRVKMLIEKDLSLCAPLVCIKGLESKYYSKLINASSEYILALEKIQEEDCGFAFNEIRIE